MKNLEECLVNMQDICKFFWLLMGFRLWRNYMNLYVVEKEDIFIFSGNFLGVDLGVDGENF